MYVFNKTNKWLFLMSIDIVAIYFKFNISFGKEYSEVCSSWVIKIYFGVNCHNEKVSKLNVPRFESQT